MSTIQLNESISVETPLGRGYAILIETGGYDDYWWTVALDTGAIVTFSQDKIRMTKSYSYGRGITDEKMKEIIK